ncbi:hypothetical protein R1flu_006536 [Riccia fluitans]|uniref:Uncharacterized protein n=1 Tax=Riccia fluitans TaxID=41844 RepID=A0ABD1YW97_9MARC
MYYYCNCGVRRDVEDEDRASAGMQDSPAQPSPTGESIAEGEGVAVRAGGLKLSGEAGDDNLAFTSFPVSLCIVHLLPELGQVLRFVGLESRDESPKEQTGDESKRDEAGLEKGRAEHSINLFAGRV